MTRIFNPGSDVGLSRPNYMFNRGNQFWWYNEEPHSKDFLDMFDSGGIKDAGFLAMHSHAKDTWVEYGLPGAGAANTFSFNRELETGDELYPDWARVKAIISSLSVFGTNQGGTAARHTMECSTRLPGTPANQNEGYLYFDSRYWGNTANDKLYKEMPWIILPLDSSGKAEYSYNADLAGSVTFNFGLIGFIL